MRELLEKLSSGINLEENEAYEAMLSIMNGELTPSQIAGFLMGLKMKGETIDEITGFVKAMREKSNKVIGPEGLLDTCGTGGDGASTFNVSTAAAIVVSAAGIPVAKHGNRSVSSKCGSADVFNKLGVKIDMPPDQAQKCLQEIGLAFLFAPVYHPSMKHAVIPRREMGIRTVFNILGPMSNPAGVKKQLVGAFNIETAEKMVRVLKNTGSEHVLVMHSEDGLDEISISADTIVFELKDGQIQKQKIRPEDTGIPKQSRNAINGGDDTMNADIIRTLLQGKKGPSLDITALNAGAAIYTAGKSDSIKQGVEIAYDMLFSGKASAKLAELIDFSSSIPAN
ncbi:anthranilate phosphoribosyltransferase [candidate division KSB1 bacterium]|nr:anthranilate phosphoribosyltransferase [candidate division KSB1 bacterium]